MKKEELILKTKQKLDEINDKIMHIKKMVEQNTNEAIQERGEDALNELEKLGEGAKEEYLKLGMPEEFTQSQITEVERNIFNSIEAFDSAFKRAGSIFKTH